MKSMKRVLTLLLAFVLVFSLSGCGGKKNIPIVNSVSGACGSMTVTGTLGNSGKIKVNGTFPYLANRPLVYKDAVFDYKKSGNRVTLKNGQSVIAGTYDSSTGVFTVDYQSELCEVWRMAGLIK